MPIIAAVIIALAALAYAGYMIYTLVAAQFGAAMGGGAVLLSAAIGVALISLAVKRYYRLHGKTVDKQRVLNDALRDDGSIQIEPNNKSGVIKRAQQADLAFIFADIQHVQIQGDKTVQLQLRGATEPINLSFDQAATATLWVKRLQMAAEQKL